MELNLHLNIPRDKEQEEINVYQAARCKTSPSKRRKTASYAELLMNATGAPVKK